MENAKSSLVLKKMVFDKIIFERKGYKTEHELKLKMQVQIGLLNEKVYKVSLLLDGDKEAEYHFVIVLSGIFTIDDTEVLDDQKAEDLINKNAVAILMPYLRSEVSLLTAQPDTDTVVLPPFNIVKMMDNMSEM